MKSIAAATTQRARSIAILVEGETEERALFPLLREFLGKQLAGTMPKLLPLRCDGRVPKGDELRRRVKGLLEDRHDAVIALTDAYTGTKDFIDAADAKRKMREWVGEEDRFHPHVALHDFEAWLLPYWADIQRLAGTNRAAPASDPETVNHDKPPAEVLKEIFRTGTKGRRYVKTRDAVTILRGKDIVVAAAACSELRAFLNTVLVCAGGSAWAPDVKAPR